MHKQINQNEEREKTREKRERETQIYNERNIEK